MIADGISENYPVMAAGSPQTDQSLVVSKYGKAVTIDGSDPVLPASFLTSSFDVASRLRLSWQSEKPLLVMENNQSVQALRVDTAAQAGPPTPDDEIFSMPSSMRYHGEDVSAAELGENKLLAFNPYGETGESGYGNLARWVIAAHDDTISPYFRVEKTGTLSFPEPADTNRRWIQVHPLADNQWILTWAVLPPGTMVFDVMMAKVTLNAEEEPEWASPVINVSSTAGQTDNSDYPIILPVADGEFWVCWRESTFGPRVALYTSQMERISIAAPDNELSLDMGQPISAITDSEGDLHLAAVTWEASETSETSETAETADATVIYWHLLLP